MSSSYVASERNNLRYGEVVADSRQGWSSSLECGRGGGGGNATTHAVKEDWYVTKCLYAASDLETSSLEQSKE
jgi:hypothetical protein